MSTKVQPRLTGPMTAKSRTSNIGPWAKAYRAMMAIAILGFTGVVVFAADSPEQIAERLAQTALTNPTTMEIVTDLTTEIGPRLAGSVAEKRAAQWAKQRFERLGFDRVWVEEFPLEAGWERGVETAEIISPSPQPLVIAALGGSAATPPEGIEAEIVLFETFDALLAAPAGSLTGKIAVVTQPMIRTQDGGSYGFVGKARFAGPAEAARRGAVAYLLRSLGTDHHRMPHTGMTEYSKAGPRIPAGALSVPDAEQLVRIAASGKPIRLKLVLTPREFRPATSQNVVAEITGREQPDEIVQLGAHLDSWDLGTGAVDDGAGVAIVMTAGSLIRNLLQRPKRTIRVVLYGAEEVGLVGGKAYAEKHKAELDRFVMVAEPDLGQGPVYAFQTGVADPDEPSLKRIRAALARLGVVPGDNLSKGSSDVGPLARAGVPAVTLKLDGTDYFDFHHTPDDTLDKIDSKRINQSAAAYTIFTYLAAELSGDYRAKPAR
jgi:carboxypeptidase Q